MAFNAHILYIFNAFNFVHTRNRFMSYIIWYDEEVLKWMDSYSFILLNFYVSVEIMYSV